jgi:hypothetical protein
VSGGSRTRLSDAAGRCLGCSATDTQARTEGVEPSASRLELDCSPGSTSLASGRDRTRTCKGLRLARLPTGCHRACWLALPYRTVPEAEVRVELTSSGLTVRCLAARLLCRTCRKRWRIARLSHILITHGSSGGWSRASGLLLFRETLLPPELHRNRSETPAGVEPASRSGCSRLPEPSGPTSSRNKSRRWDSNPLGPRYEGGARPVEQRRPYSPLPLYSG